MLITNAPLVNATALSIPLACLSVLLGLLSSSLFFGDATLLVNLSPLLLRPPLILIPLILCPTLLFGNTPLFQRLPLLILALRIKAAATLLHLILSLLFSSALRFCLSPLLFVVLALLFLCLALLLKALLLLTLARGLPLLFVSLPPLLVLRLSLLALLLLTLLSGLALLFGSLSLLLVLRLARVVPALGFSLLALLIVLTATTAATAFALRLSGLRLSGLLIPLLPFCSLPLPVFTVLRLLRVRQATCAREKHHTNSRCQRDAIKVTTFHD